MELEHSEIFFHPQNLDYWHSCQEGGMVKLLLHHIDEDTVGLVCTECKRKFIIERM